MSSNASPDGAIPLPMHPAIRLSQIRLHVLGNLVNTASRVFGTSMAGISFLEGEALVLRYGKGLKDQTVPVEQSLCGCTLQKGRTLVVSDLKSHKTLKTHPMAASAPYARFYCGTVLHGRNGTPLGTLFVLDRKPRKPNRQQIRLLETLGRQASALLEAHLELVHLRRKLEARARSDFGNRVGEKVLRRVFEDIPIGIGFVNRNMDIVAANRELCSMLGYEEEELKNLDLQKLVGPPVAEKDRSITRKLFLEELSFYRTEQSWTRADGRQIWVSLTISPVRDDSGQVMLGVIMLENLTKEKEIQEELQRAFRSLEDRVEQRTKELAVTNELLEQRVLEKERAEYRFRMLLESSPDGIIISDEDGKIILANQATEQMFGYSKEELLGQEIEILLPESLREKHRELRKQFTRERLSRPMGRGMLLQALSKDGRLIPVEIGLSVFEIDQEVLVFAAIRDISIRVKAERENAKLAALVENSTDLIGMTDMEGNVVYVNRAGRRILGIEEVTDLQTLNLFDFILDEDVEAVRDHLLPDLKRNGNWVGEFRLRNYRTGELVDFEIVSFVVYDPFSGRPVGLAGVCRDIRARKAVEARLAASERKYRRLFEESNDTILIFTLDGRILDINSAGLRLLGIESPESLHEWSGLQDLMVKPQAFEKLRSDLLAEGHIHNRELEIIGRDGKTVTVLASMSLAQDEEEPEHIVRCIFHDITERKRLQQQLLHSQKMEAIGTLAGGIAHDFNNILAAIIGYTEMAATQVPAPGDVYDDLQEVLKAANRARELVNQILTFSRQREQARQVVSLTNLVKETMKMLRASIPSTIEIQTDLSISDAYVYGNPTHLHQVIMNLCTNAYQAMKDTGGTLSVSLDRVPPSVVRSEFGADSSQDREYVRLVVRDTGCGMDDEVKRRIFNPFFTTKAPGEGTGMGLSVVHGIIEDHDGFIDVWSQPGEGSAFTVYFPLCEKHVPHSESADRDDMPGGSERVLLVDDEEMLVNVGKRQLESLGYSVMAHTESERALEAFANDPDAFDVVIADYTMPGMTGLDLASSMLKIRPDIPIVIVTGFAEMVDSRKFQELGIHHLMLKPVSTRRLAHTLRRVLDMQQERVPHEAHPGH